MEGSCYFTIEKGTIEATLGTADRADLTVEAPFEVWMDIVTRKADGMQMFMEGKYQVDGNISLMGLLGQ